MRMRRAQPWLGTVVEILAEGDDSRHLHTGFERAFARIAAIHRAMSFQSIESELTTVNRYAYAGWMALSPDLATVFAAAQEFARATAGRFDPSVAGWLVDSGHLPRHPGFPASASPDWRAIELDGARVRYRRPLLVDLSGIAKGYAVDQALAALRSAGLSGATVNAGGDLARFGAGTAPIHVRLPHRPTCSVRLAELACGAAATSASYFQPGTLRHPSNGGALCDALSVTVLAADCTTADALTKLVAADIKAATPRRAGETAEVLARYGAEAVVMDRAGAMRCDADGWTALPGEQAA